MNGSHLESLQFYSTLMKAYVKINYKMAFSWKYESCNLQEICWNRSNVLEMLSVCYNMSLCARVCVCVFVDQKAAEARNKQKTNFPFKITFKVYSKKKSLQENTWLPVIHTEDIS